jgi:hypothetical protein
VSITGYGRALPGGGWVGFGDDAAVAAGLSARGPGPPLFCGDAIADPLTGLHAAVAALASWRMGGGALLDLPLRGVVAHALAFDAPCGEAEIARDAEGWEVRVGERRARVVAPRARPPRGRAPGLGADTAAVLGALAC